MPGEYRELARRAMMELLDAANLKKGDLVVVGLSSSEVAGHTIGTDSQPELAQELFLGLYQPLQQAGLYLAAQCCEHLNRALIIEEEAMEKYGLEQVNVCPQPKAGGSFATAAWQNFTKPVAVERLQAGAGLDIGSTLIGMHLRPVAIPLRLSVKSIGGAAVTAARTRPKFIGGERAMYNKALL